MSEADVQQRICTLCVYYGQWDIACKTCKNCRNEYLPNFRGKKFTQSLIIGENGEYIEKGEYL